MNLAQSVERKLLVFARHVEDLATDHALRTRGNREFLHERRHERWRGAGRDQLECQSHHRIAGEDGHRFAEDLVVGGPAATKIVVVHGGEIVVDEGEGVDQLHRSGGGDSGRKARHG